MDGLLKFAASPAGQGLLGAVFAGLAGARRGAPMNSLGAAGLGGLLSYNNAQEGQIKQQLQKAQLDQVKRRNQMIDSLLNPGAAAVPAALAQGAQVGDQPGGFDGNGTYTPPVKNVGPTVTNLPRLQQVQSGPVSGGGTYGIPRDAIAMDLALNDGKSVSDWMFKRGTPDIQVSNGYAYDKNRVQPGFLPQSNVSQNGQATVTTIGPDGLPRVSAPAGALQAYAQYRNADEAAKAGYDVQKVWNPDTQRYEFMSRSRVIQNSQADQSTSAPRFNVTGNPAAFRQQLVRSGDKNAVNAFDAQYGGRVPSGISAEPSIAEQNSAKGSEKYTVDVAGDTAAQRKAIMEAGMTAPDRIAKIQQIGTLLSNVDGGTLTPQGTQLASAANSWGLKIDKNLPNKEAASSLGNELALSLRSTAGGGGMPGALSDSDRQFLVSMTPNMSQSKQGRDMLIQSMTAVEQRKSDVADMARRYEQKYGALDNNFFRQLQQWSNTHPLFKK